MNERRGVYFGFLCCLLYKITNHEHTSQFNIVKGPNSNWFNDLLIFETKTFTVFDNFLTFRDSNQTFELKGDLFRMIGNFKFEVNNSIPQVGKLT